MRSFLLVLLGSLIVTPDLDAQRRRRAHVPPDLKHYDYRLESFEAESLPDSDGEFGIYLPKGYDENEAEYPWILWLHGMNEDASRFHDGGGASVLDRLRGEAAIPEVILVAPTAPRRTIYADGESEGDVEKYILTDLMGHLEKHYRLSTLARRRALMGVSMGGMGALRIALSDPGRFSTVAVHSAAAFPPDPTALSDRSGQRIQRTIQGLGLSQLLGDPVRPEQWARFIPSAMASQLDPADLKSLRIYFDAGTDDRYGFGPPNQEFHEILEKRKIPHSFTMVDGGGHSWGSGTLQERLAHSLKFVAEGLDHTDARDAAKDDDDQ